MCRVGDMLQHIAGLVGNLGKFLVGKGVQNDTKCCFCIHVIACRQFRDCFFSSNTKNVCRG